MLRSFSVVTRRAVGFVRLAVLVPFVGAATLVSACGTDSTAPDIPSNPAVEVYAPSLGVNIATMTKRTDNLYVQDLVVGTGAEAIVGRTITVTYSGFLINGTRFDSNVGGTPFSFALGGNVIAGWNQGVAGMKVGGKRRLVIGSNLGYGREGSGSRIPPNSTLVFDVEVLSVQ